MSWQRPLTGMERWQWLFDRAAPMNSVLVARVVGRFDQERLRQALDTVAGHYPTITARVEPDERPRFVGGSVSVDLRLLPWQRGAWRSCAVEEVNRRIPAATGPLMRTVLLDGADCSDLLVSFNQIIADGQAGAHILEELLTIYGGGARPALVSPEVLEPPLDNVLGSRFRALRTTLSDIPMMRRLSPLRPGRWVPPAERRTALIDVQLPASRTERLARRASSRGASVHGAFAAAMLMAIGTQLRGGDHTRRDHIGCATSVDLRRRAGLSSEAVGTLLSQVVSCHQVHYDTLFWDLAAEVSKAIRESVGRGNVFAYARMKDAQAIGVSDAALDQRVAKSERSHRAAAVVNNLGRLSFYERFGDVELERMSFLVSNNAYVGSSLVLSVVTVADKTCLNFTFADPLLSPRRAQQLVDGTLSALDQVDR